MRVPVSEKGQNIFTEYIYNNGQWEELGKNIKIVDQEAFRSFNIDTNGWDGRCRLMFCNAKGSCNAFEVSKINGQSIIGYESPANIEVAATKEVTQEEYDALSPEDGVLYVITDAKEVGVPTKLSDLEQDIELGTTYAAGEGIKIEDDTISLNTSIFTNGTENSFTLSALRSNGSKSIFIIYGSDTIKIKTDDNNTYPVLSVSDDVALKSDISNKQDTLVSGVNIKTINGIDILGEGNIIIQGGEGGSVDMSNYYTKTEIDALIGGVETKITEINEMV